MATYQFKTNIQCEACIGKVTPFLNNAKEIESWTVDTKNPDKILTVTGPDHSEVQQLTIRKIKMAGYKIDPI